MAKKKMEDASLPLGKVSDMPMPTGDPPESVLAQPVPPAIPPETKAARFKRLANRRVPAAVKRIAHVANLARRAQYEYTPEQAAKIVEIITAAAKQVASDFAGTKAVVNGQLFD